MAGSRETPAQLRRENAQLRARLRLLEDAVEHMYDGFSVFDAEGRILACNRRYAEVLGLPPDEVQPGIMARKLVELGMAAGVYPPDKTEDELFAAMWHNFTCSDEERQTLVRSGRVLAAHPQLTADGNIVATLQDITARTETETALRASEARLGAIRAVINLGKNLGIKVVAEGIESMTQAERLIELGCDYGQGFLFSKAVPGDRVPPLVTSLAGLPPKPARAGLKLVGGRK